MITHKPLRQAMKDAISQTLENMLFLEATEHYDQNYAIPAEELTWANLALQAPIQGEIRLALPKGVLKALTGSVFLLEEAKISQTHMDDILAEILNTIGGIFMTNLLADKQIFKIGLPEQGQGALPPVNPETLVWKMMTGEKDPLQVYATGAALVAMQDTANATN